jgi:hypothetical protein
MKHFNELTLTENKKIIFYLSYSFKSVIKEVNKGSK